MPIECNKRDLLKISLTFVAGDAAANPAPHCACCDGADRSTALGQNNVRYWGAVGDGVSRTIDDATLGVVGIGKRFADLDAARVASGISNLELTDELDWFAHQAAMNACASGGGGTVFTPSGIYMMNRTLTLPRQGKFNEEERRQTLWVGEGDRNAVLSWPQDLGPGAYAVYCEGWATTDSNQHQWAPMRDLQLRGPAYGESRTPGVANCEMHGLALGPGRHLDNVRIRYFNRGVDFRGGQMTFRQVDVNLNHVALYFNAPRVDEYGDLLFLKCWFTGCTLAAIAVNNTATIGGAQFIGSYIGGAPYCILGEAGGSDRLLMNDVSFLGVQFEYAGNAMFWDDNWTSASGNASPRRWSIQRVKMQDCYYHNVADGNDNTWTGDGRGRHYVMRLKNIIDLQINGPREPAFGWRPGSQGFINCEMISGVFEGEIQAILEGCASAGVRFVSGPTGWPISRLQIRNHDPYGRDWEGELAAFWDSAVTISRGDVVSIGGEGLQGVRKANFAGITRPFGIAAEAAKTNEWLVVARRGVFDGVNAAAAPTGKGKYFKVNSAAGVYGQCVETASPYDNGVIGISMNTGSAQPMIMLDM